MIDIKDKKNCCGCHACFNICPKKAITMACDEKGFKYPIIDKEKCIDCGLCEKVCPILNRKKEEEKKVSAYACYNKNENERINSSSGGIFILLAKEIIKRKGIVFGAQLNEEFKVVHSYAESEEGLKKFQGSKYVQSNIGETYKLVKKHLNEDRYVLFTGTPCQIEGLYSFLQKKYDKLYTQDIICHGVPSPMVWEKYKEYRKSVDNDIPQKIEFRNKDNGWKLFNMKFSYKNKNYMQNQHQDLFMQAFLKNTILRDSCYSCNFKRKYRNSDITLADFWGIEHVQPDFDDNKGISAVIINSEKGRELFNSISKKIECRNCDLEQIININSSMIKSVTKDNNSDKFFENLNKLSFEKNVEKNTYHTTLFKRGLKKIKNTIKKIFKKI